jgi:3-ketosteroid 9alpha-monooxygenase subunit A
VTLHPLDPFPFGWYQAAFTQELARGDVRALRLLGRDFVLWRDEDGEAHVMDAFCAHLGAHLGYGGRVEGRELRCPFHAWSYDGSGECVKIPYSHKRHKLARVRSYPVCERNGMVLLWWHPQAGEPLWQAPQIPEWADGAWSDGYVRTHCWSIRSKWREIAENGIDMTHFYYLHGVAALPQLERFQAEGHVWHSLIGHRFNTPLGERPGSFELFLHGPGLAWQRFVIDGVAEVVFAINISQIDEDVVSNRFSFLVPKQPIRADLPEMSERLIQEIIDQVTEDVPIWENKIIKDPPRLARGDGPIMAFRKWTEQFSAPAPQPSVREQPSPIRAVDRRGQLSKR